jgi:hypothetical protein
VATKRRLNRPAVSVAPDIVWHPASMLARKYTGPSRPVQDAHLALTLVPLSPVRIFAGTGGQALPIDTVVLPMLITPSSTMPASINGRGAATYFQSAQAGGVAAGTVDLDATDPASTARSRAARAILEDRI